MVNFSVYLNRLVFVMRSNEPRHAKMYLLAYADSDGIYQLALPRNMIRAFAVHNQSHWKLNNVSNECNGPDETAYVQDDVKRQILRMFEGTILLDEVHIITRLS